MRINTSLSLFFLLVACGQDDTVDDRNLPSCEEDDRDDSYFAGINKVGAANYGVALVDSNPSPPAKGDNRWSIEVTDPEGNTAAGLTIGLTGFMPDHGHGTPVIPTVSGDGEGGYAIDPVNLFMPGYWEVSITITDPGELEGSDDDVKLDTVTFKFCVEG